MMRNGKVSENVLVRSILRRIKTKREEVICGAGIGADCAVLTFGEDEETVLSVNPVCAPIDGVCTYGIYRALNNIAAAGAEPAAVMLAMMLPEGTEEKALQVVMEQAEVICSHYHIQVIGGHTEVSGAVHIPTVTVTGIGKRKKNARRDLHTVKAGQDIIISKWIGLEGTVRIAKEHRAELLTRYPVKMIEEAAAFERFLCVIPDAATAGESGVCGMHDVSQGGIFGALWELAQGAGVGLEIDLKKLPVRQETIEICEFYDLNPYELSSGGCLLMTAEDGVGLAATLEKEGIPAVIVGKTTAGNDRVVFNEEERRFLEPPKTDQLYEMMNNDISDKKYIGIGKE